eukprot:6005945-Pyramimonas_sp.AAC.1
MQLGTPVRQKVARWRDELGVSDAPITRSQLPASLAALRCARCWFHLVFDARGKCSRIACLRTEWRNICSGAGPEPARPPQPQPPLDDGGSR